MVAISKSKQIDVNIYERAGNISYSMKAKVYIGVALETSWSLNQRYLNWKELLEDSTQPLAQSKTNFKARGGFIRKSPLHPPPPTACVIASLFISLWIAHLQGSIIEKCLKGVISAAHALLEATLRAISISLSVLDTSHIWSVHQELFLVSYWNSFLPTHFAAEIVWRLQSPEDKKIQCFLTTQGCKVTSVVGTQDLEEDTGTSTAWLQHTSKSLSAKIAAAVLL